VVTAKCSEVNVHVLPDGDDAGGAAPDADPQEFPIPEQFVSTFDKNGQLVTAASKHSGA
jgi:hypothetical protein